MRFVCLLVGMMLASASASGQVQPSGTFTPGHTARILNPAGTAIGDAGGSAGSAKNGSGYLTELGITNTGTPLCINDALTSDLNGYHQLCFGANALGGGILSYNANGGASDLPFSFYINGVLIPALPGSVTGLPEAVDNTALQALASTFATAVMRLDYAVGNGAPPLIYRSSNSSCSLNGGNGDNGSQVKSADSKCWLAAFPSSGIDPREFGAVNTGAASPLDDAPITAAIAVAQLEIKPLALSGAYGVAGPINFHGTSAAPLTVIGNQAVFNGYAAVTTTALVDITSYVIIQNLDLYGQFNAHYTAGLWQHNGASPAQFNHYENVNTAGFLTCFRLGDRLFPQAIVSETSISGGQTYGCPTVALVEGANTVISANGVQWTEELGSVNVAGAGWYSSTSTTSINLSTTAIGASVTATMVDHNLTVPLGIPIEFHGSSGGGMSQWLYGTVTAYTPSTGSVTFTVTKKQGTSTINAWNVRPPLASVDAVGGLITIAASELNNEFVAHTILAEPLEPTLSGGLAQYGAVKLYGCACDVGGNIADTVNPLALSTTSGAPTTLLFDGLTGFASHDVSFVNTDSTYNGIIFVKNNAILTTARTTPYITAGSTNTVVVFDEAGFFSSSPTVLSQTVGGTPKFSYRQTLEAFASNAASLSTGVVKFNAVNNSDGDLGYWATKYSASTGAFTIPTGGFTDVHVTCAVDASGITSGQLYIRHNGTQATVSSPFANAGQVTFDAKVLAATDTLDCFLNVLGGSGTITNFVSYLTIFAANQ